jgi:hypothetical protein
LLAGSAAWVSRYGRRLLLVDLLLLLLLLLLLGRRVCPGLHRSLHRQARGVQRGGWDLLDAHLSARLNVLSPG